MTARAILFFLLFSCFFYSLPESAAQSDTESPFADPASEEETEEGGLGSGAGGDSEDANQNDATKDLEAGDTGLIDSGSSIDFKPEPYSPDEFPEWMHDLRRFEIIMFGTIPITALFSYFTYSLIRFAINDFDSDYLPIGSPDPVPYTLDENVWIMVVAGSVSLVIAVVDFIIGEVREGEEGPHGAI